MKVFIQLVALSFVVTLLATVVALTIERAQPDTVRVSGLDRCDGVPCFGGIAPGKTSVTEAIHQILSTYALIPVSVYSKYVSYQLNDDTVLSVRYSSFASVEDVALESSAGANLATLGQLVALLGAPQTVGWGTGGAVIFCFPGLCVENFQHNHMPVTVDWPITLMTYSRLPDQFVTSNRPWHGFGTYRPY